MTNLFYDRCKGGYKADGLIEDFDCTYQSTKDKNTVYKHKYICEDIGDIKKHLTEKWSEKTCLTVIEYSRKHKVSIVKTLKMGVKE